MAMNSSSDLHGEFEAPCIRKSHALCKEVSSELCIKAELRGMTPFTTCSAPLASMLSVVFVVLLASTRVCGTTISGNAPGWVRPHIIFCQSWNYG